jgi:hypothetical protein
MPNNPRTPLETRLWQRIVKTDACWLYGGTIMKNGYGAIGRGGRHGGHIYTHRLAFELAYGPIPDGMHVLHTCDVRNCCRNDDKGWYEVNGILHPRRGHLWLGTHQDNMDDRENKGRSQKGDLHPSHIHADLMARGEHHGQSKLTDQLVRIIRTRYANGDGSQYSLAREYGVTQSTVRFIVLRRTWKHVKD